MKPDSNPPGTPFNFDAIPLWLKPDLWDEQKDIPFRGVYFVLLYTLSYAVFLAIVFVPVGIYKGIDMAGTTALVWLGLSVSLGVLLSLAVWWDFIRASRKLAAAASDPSLAESPPNVAEEQKER